MFDPILASQRGKGAALQQNPASAYSEDRNTRPGIVVSSSVDGGETDVRSGGDGDDVRRGSRQASPAAAIGRLAHLIFHKTYNQLDELDETRAASIITSREFCQAQGIQQCRFRVVFSSVSLSEPSGIGVCASAVSKKKKKIPPYSPPPLVVFCGVEKTRCKPNTIFGNSAERASIVKPWQPSNVISRGF